MERDKSNQGNNQGGGSGGTQQSGGTQNQSKYSDNRSDPNHKDYDPNWQPGPVGAVQDPEFDGRLKENREAGRTKGTTEHSSKAPNIDRDNSNSINNRDEGNRN